jgi:hypothetical protein
MGSFTPATGEVGRDAMMLEKPRLRRSNEVGIVWSFKALETNADRTGIYILLVRESDGM